MASTFLRGKSYHIIYYDQGRKVQKSLSHFNGGRPVRDKKTAEYLKRTIELDLMRGDSPVATRTATVEALLEDYERDSLKRNAAKTVRDDLKRLRDFFDVTGIRYVDQITLPRFDKYAAGLTRPTANRLIDNTKTFLNYLIDRGMLNANPLAKAKKYRHTTNPPQFYTKDEMEALLKAAKADNLETYKLVCIGLYAGLRIKEMMFLEWKDFDFPGSLLTVVNKDGFKTKSRKFRVIPIARALAEALRPLVKSGYCLYKDRDRTFDPKKHLYRVQKAAGVKVTGPHILRHTFASRLVQEGVSIYKVSKWLGHSSVRVTEIYAHLIPQNDGDIDRI